MERVIKPFPSNSEFKDHSHEQGLQDGGDLPDTPVDTYPKIRLCPHLNAPSQKLHGSLSRLKFKVHDGRIRRRVNYELNREQFEELQGENV